MDNALTIAAVALVLLLGWLFSRHTPGKCANCAAPVSDAETLCDACEGRWQ